MKKNINKDIVRIKQLMFNDKKNTDDKEESDTIELEFSEEDAAASSDAGASAGYPTVTKWETKLNRGKANPISNNKWESGVTRGKANTLL